MCRSSIVEHEPVAVHQLAKLITIHVVDTIEPYIEVTDNIDRYFNRETIENRNKFVKESLMHSCRARSVDDG